MEIIKNFCLVLVVAQAITVGCFVCLTFIQCFTEWVKNKKSDLLDIKHLPPEWEMFD